MNIKNLILLTTVFLCFTTTSFAQKIIETGINYETVKILEKRAYIKNPVSIVYYKTTDKVIFENYIDKQKKTAGYWISKTNEPDKIILNKKQIYKLNNDIYNLNLGISKLKEYPQNIKKEVLEKKFEQIFSYISKKNYLNEFGEYLFPDFFITLQNNFDIPQQDNINVRFAITTKYNDVRLLPTSQKIISNINSKDLDRLQEESIDLGTPVIVLSQTKDKIWCYVVTPTEEGWIKTTNLAFTDKKTFDKWADIKKPVVITNSKTDIFTDKEKTNFLEYVRMGTKLPYVSKNGKISICVNIPTSDNNGNLITKKGYLNSKDINIGYLDYTQRNALNLAFNHLHSPYGWGGSNGEQDCSGYLSQIFNCFGILLPETSLQKIKCGKVIILDNKSEEIEKNFSIIEQGVPGITFVYLPGHIMLYIGSYNYKPYVIQCIWGLTSFTEKNEKTISYINKIIVSDLNIGSDVAGNSLIDRVSKFNIIK